MKINNGLAYNFPEIISHFFIVGEIVEVTLLGSGHIHDTFRLENGDSTLPDYVLQRINHNVFQNVPALSENIRKVTDHLKNKLKLIEGVNPDKEVLTVIPTLSGSDWYEDENNNFWRVFVFLKNTRSYDIVKTKKQAFEGGKAYGTFIRLLADMDASLLYETLSKFHDIESRLSILKKVSESDPKGRLKEVKDEISFIEERAQGMSSICRLGKAGKLPLRITHNDTKFNNVLLNDSDEAQCVIDLDTVMPGYVAYDFGDAVRTLINRSPEDEKEVRNIRLDMNLFEGFSEGFLKELMPILQEEEIRSLAQGVLLLPFIMGVRFLTDYIVGDTYYKIHFPEHNLQRARAQFALVSKLEEQHSNIQQIILNIAEKESKQQLNPNGNNYTTNG